MGHGHLLNTTGDKGISLHEIRPLLNVNGLSSRPLNTQYILLRNRECGIGISKIDKQHQDLPLPPSKAAVGGPGVGLLLKGLY